MRRRGLLIIVGATATVVGASACARDNPNFDLCLDNGACAPETGSAGDGDGDGDASGDGDGAPTGDGDGASGDGDGAPGDGDGEPGDGDGEPGDGDGEPGLPTCPNPDWVEIPLVEDTFLDGSYPQGQGCLIDLAMNLANAPCNMLDFGGALEHWVCSGPGCNSRWLGRFAIEEWVGLDAQVYEAGFVFTARVQSFQPNAAQAFELEVDGVDFGECLTWMAGNGVGDPPGPCVTTQWFAANPHLWGLALEQVEQQVAIAAANIPPNDAPTETMFAMPIDPALVQTWISSPDKHTGVLLTTMAVEPTNFILRAQGSGHDPVLRVKLCVPP